MFDLHDSMQSAESFTRMLLPNPPLHFSDPSALPPQNTYELYVFVFVSRSRFTSLLTY